MWRFAVAGSWLVGAVEQSQDTPLRATLEHVKPADIREFAHRNRAEVEALKQRYWAEQHRVFGNARTAHVSQALWRYMRRLRPDWPSAHDRAQDLAHHIELKRKIDQAAHAFATR